MSQKRKLEDLEDVSELSQQKKKIKNSDKDLIEILKNNNKVLLDQKSLIDEQIKINNDIIKELEQKNSFSVLTSFENKINTELTDKKNFFFEYKLNFKKFFEKKICETTPFLDFKDYKLQLTLVPNLTKTTEAPKNFDISLEIISKSKKDFEKKIKIEIRLKSEDPQIFIGQEIERVFSSENPYYVISNFITYHAINKDQNKFVYDDKFIIFEININF